MRQCQWSTIPKLGTPQSAGFDVTAAVYCVIPPWGYAIVSTGLCATAPPGTYIRVARRSGLTRNHALAVGAGIADADHRGDIGVILFNHTGVVCSVTTGDKIAHLICEQCVLPTVPEVTSMDDTSGGTMGFHRTGRSVLTPTSLSPSFQNHNMLPLIQMIAQYKQLAHIGGGMPCYAFARILCGYATVVWAGVHKTQTQTQNVQTKAYGQGQETRPTLCHQMGSRDSS